MLLYNVTVGIDAPLEQEWLEYIRGQQIPAVLKTGMFVDAKIYKVMNDSNDGTISYSIQYFANNLDNVQQYLEIFAPAIVQHHRERFINRHVSFMTLLEEI